MGVVSSRMTSHPHPPIPQGMRANWMEILYCVFDSHQIQTLLNMYGRFCGAVLDGVLLHRQ